MLAPIAGASSKVKWQACKPTAVTALEPQQTHPTTTPLQVDSYTYKVYEEGKPEPRSVAPTAASYSVTVDGLKPSKC